MDAISILIAGGVVLLPVMYLWLVIKTGSCKV